MWREKFVSSTLVSDIAMTMELETIDRIVVWNSDTKYALGYYELLGRNLGIWPIESKRLAPKLKATFVVITQLWMALSLIKKLITMGNCGAVTDIVDVLSLIIGGFLTVMKIILPRVYQQNMSIIITSAIDDWSRVITGESHDIMMKYAFIGRIVFIVQMCGVYAVAFPLIVLRMPFISALWIDQSINNVSLRQTPIGPACWISGESSLYSYIGDFTIHAIQLFIVCTAYIGCDTYFFGLGMHLCGQFELLYIQLDDFYGNGEVFEQRQKLKNFIERHNQLLQLADNFEEAYTLIILAQIAADTLLICISAIVLLMSLGSGDYVTIIALIIRIYLVYIQLFLYSYVGEILNRVTENLQKAVYNSPWYNISRSIVKDMQFVIMRNNYRFNLTAGKIYPMNFESFKDILKTMGSYFSVLRLMFIDY